MNNGIRKKIKHGLTILTLLTVPFFLTGCFHNRGARNQAVTNRTQTLTIWRLQTDKATEQVYRSLEAAFEKQNTTIDVKYRTFSTDDDYEGTVLNALAASSGPDIWEIRNDELPRHKDKLRPYPPTTLDLESFARRYAPVISEEMVSDNKLYGMPLGLDPLVVFVNADHVKKAKVNQAPKTWQEMIELANKLTVKADGTILRGGLALGTASNIDRSSEIVQLLMLQFGTQMVDPAHRTATFDLYTQDSEAQTFEYPGKTALGLYASFAANDSPYQSWDATQPNSIQAFLEGNLSMMINYLSVGPQLKRLSPKFPLSVIAVPQYEVKTLPSGDRPANITDPVYTAKYRSLVVSKPSLKLSKKDQDDKVNLAWQFIQTASSPGVIQAFTKAAGLAPPYIVPQSTGSQSSIATIVNPYLKTWHKGPNPRAVDEILREMTRSITEDGQDIHAMFNQAAQAITAILQGENLF